MDKIVKLYRDGVFSKSEMFAGLARKAISGNEAFKLDLTENEQVAFFEWIETHVLGESFIVAGGVGRLFSISEVNHIRSWFKKRGDSHK